MSARSLSCAETAKLVRAALRDAFPGIRFSVRSCTYSMGASIDVYWTDGPTEAQVRGVTDRFRCSDFDGSDDSTTYRPSTLLSAPDGTVEDVRFGADFIEGHRTLSPDFRSLLADDFEHWLGEPYEANKRYAATFTTDGRLVPCRSSMNDGYVLLHRLAQATSVDAERAVWRVAP